MAKILVIYAGGTIGSQQTPNGLQPYAPGHFEKLFRARITGPDMPIYDFMEMPNLVDSSRANVEDWMDIATIIDRQRLAYDGFVVLHGTDTMANAAAALSFSLTNIDRPVVLTGSHVPLVSNNMDPRDNTYLAMRVASDKRMNRVSLWFGDRLMAGTRAIKIDCENPNAFDSPNASYLATLDDYRRISYAQAFCRPKGAYKFTPFKDQNVFPLEVPAGRTGAMFLNAVLQGVKMDGVVLKAFGNGNITSDFEPLVRTLLDLQAKGTTVVLSTQCLHGTVDARYAAGSWLGRLGVIPAGDMTSVAAVTKLQVLCSQGLNAKRRASAFLRPMVDEITVPQVPANLTKPRPRY